MIGQCYIPKYFSMAYARAGMGDRAKFCIIMNTHIVLCMRSANERRRYIATSSLIGWAHTQMIHKTVINYRTEFYQRTHIWYSSKHKYLNNDSLFLPYHTWKLIEFMYEYTIVYITFGKQC